MAQRVSLSRSPTNSSSTSAVTWLMRSSAAFTVMADPVVSITLEYRENTSIPGPMAAGPRSIVLRSPSCSLRMARGSSACRAATKPCRSVGLAAAI